MADASRRRIRAGAATAVAQLLVMAGSSLLGLLIARRLGSSGATDGFFAANAVYGVALFTAQSLRTTAPATLIDPRGGALARHLRAVGWLSLATVALFGVVAAAADVVVSDSAVDTLRLALAVLAPAAVAQLFAGLLAARCAVLGHFGLPAGAYACGTLVMAGAFVVLAGSLEVDAIAPAVAIGAFVSAATMVVVWRLAERDAIAVAPDVEPLGYDTAPRLIGHLLRGAVPVLGSQVVITVSVFSASHLGSGDGTLYSYGTLAIAVLMAIVASPVSIVLAPEIARSWDRTARSLIAPSIASYRLGALLLPALAIPILLIGPELAVRILTALSTADVETIFAVAAILIPSVLATLLAMVPLVAAVAGGLLTRVGVGVAAVALVHVPLAVAATATGSILLLAAEGMLAAVALGAVPVFVAVRGADAELLRAAARVTLRYVAPGSAVAAGLWLALGAGMQLGPNAVAVAGGLAAHAAIAATLGRDDLRLVLQLLPRAA